MRPIRQLTFWIVAACLSVLLLVLALYYNSTEAQPASVVAVPPRPAAGRLVFQQQGCISCHGADASGTPKGPALRQRASLSSLAKLVAALWNHAPRMWAAMERQGLNYPNLTYEQTSQLISYLYLSGAADVNGDARRGAALFLVRADCARCHGDDGRDPRLAATAAGGTAMDLTQALWNHAAFVQRPIGKPGLAWPHFGPNDVRDLLAYVRQQNASPSPTDTMAGADPDRGWLIFQEKGCIRCHSLSRDQGSAGPYLGQQREFPPTFSEFGAALLNHVPQMENAVGKQRLPWPVFGPNDVRDLTLFFYFLRYMEPTGSPQIGQSVFSWRGCANCHGAEAEGGSAPRLRGRGTNFTAARLATDLLRHGRSMYKQVERNGQQWPELQESDVGNLLAFLNSPSRK